MKIAQIMAGAANGGAELFYERMTVGLHRAGVDVLPVIRTNETRAAKLRMAGMEPVEYRFGGPLDVLTKWRVRADLRDFGADLAIAWMSRAASHLPEGDWITAGRLGGYYNLKYFRACRHLIGNTRGITKWIVEQGWPEDCVHYLPNFVNDFAKTQAVTRASLGVPEHVKLVLALGRLHEVKGFDTLIRAAALLPDVWFVIAGEGPERAKLEAMIAEFSFGARVKLLGWRDDAGALLKASDLFISSSRHEPLGNMVLEAFSAGTPVLATRAEGPSEVIRDMVDGVLVPIDDAAGLAAAARSILGDAALLSGLAEAGRARFNAEFAEPVVTAAWLDFCRKVIG